MKKLLLVLAAAAAPAWACIDPEQEFEDCALYSGTCQRVQLSNCKLQKLGFVDEAECSALAAAKAGKRRKKKNAMCAGATDVKAVGHKTLHLTRRTKTSLDCTS